MEALTTSTARTPIKLPHPSQRKVVVPLRWRIILDYHLAGFKAAEIAKLTNYSLSTIYRVLNSDAVDMLRQQLMMHQQKEFEALQGKVVDAIRDGLADDDPKVRAIYTNQWLKAHGKIRSEGEGQTFTAEDMVVQILNGNVGQQPVNE